MRRCFQRLPIVLLLIVLCASTLVPTPTALAKENDDYGMATWFQPLSGATPDAVADAGGTDSPDTSLQSINPADLKYTPDAVEIDGNGIVYLLSKTNRSIFRWSISERTYLPTIPLSEAPAFMVINSPLNHLYLGYPGGLIYLIDLSVSVQEVPFAAVPGTLCGLENVESFLFVCAYAGTSAFHSTYSSNGQLISQTGYRSITNEFAWNSVLKKIYYVDGPTTMADLMREEISDTGMIGTETRSPYSSNTLPLSSPIHIVDNGLTILFGSGQLYSAVDSIPLMSMPSPNTDAAWMDDTLYYLYPSAGMSNLQKWQTFVLQKQTSIPGIPAYLFSIPEGLLVISINNGIPLFSIWTSELELIFPDLSWNYLPVCQVEYCSDLMDNFDEDFGWFQGETDTWKFETVNSEYQVTVKPAEWMLILASPNCPLKNYLIQMRVHWENPGESYGLVFGIAGNFDHFYLLNVYTQYREFALWYYDGENFSLIGSPHWEPYIEPSTQMNTISVRIDDGYPTIIINGIEHPLSYLDHLPEKSRVGIIVTSSSPNAQAHFDTFWIRNLDTNPWLTPPLSQMDVPMDVPYAVSGSALQGKRVELLDSEGPVDQ